MIDCFVGRDDELKEMDAAARQALSGRSCSLVVVGEAGIGKTRILTEFADRNRTSFRTLWGRCYDETEAEPYRPISDMLEQFIREDGADALREAAGGWLSRLAPLVPTGEELAGAQLGEIRLGSSERASMFAALGATFRSIAHDPLMLIVDDVHLADKESLAALRRIAAALPDVPLLLCVAYRQTDLNGRLPLGGMLAELAKVPGSLRVHLPGLSREAFAMYVGRVAPRMSTADADALFARTEGHPLFLAELVRAGSAREQSALLPEGLLETIGRRLDGLGERTIEALQVAAIAGTEFSLATVMETSDDLDSVDVSAALERGRIAGILTETGLRRYRFTHSLFRDVLEREIPARRRLALHARLARIARDDARALHHARQALPVLPLRDYVQRALNAADGALVRLAFEEALGIADEALGAIEGREAEFDREIPELYFLRGRAYSGLESWKDAPESLVRAYDGFERHGNRRRLVEVATTPVHRELIGERALIERALGFAQGLDRARLLCHLGQYLAVWSGGDGEVPFCNDCDAARRAYEEATRLARAWGDVGTEMWAEGRLGHMLLESWDAAGMPLVERSVERAAQLGDADAEFWFTETLAWYSLWLTHPPIGRVRTAILRVEELGSRLASSELRWRAGVLRAALDLYTGRLDDGLATIESIRTLRDGDLFLGLTAQLFLHSGADDRLVRDRLRTCRSRTPTGAVFFLASCRTAVINRGWTDVVPDADELVGRHAGFREAHGRLQVGWIRACAEGGALACHRAAVEVESEIGAVAARGGGAEFFGTSIHRLAALLHAKAGEHAAALRSIERAVECDRRDGFLPDLGYALRDRGRLLRDAGEPGRAQASLEEALAISRECGMPPLEVDCLHLLTSIAQTADRTPRLPDGLTPREAEVAALLVEGLTNREIGDRLYISPRTAGNHVQRVLDKTGSGNRAEAAAYAIRHGLAT